MSFDPAQAVQDNNKVQVYKLGGWTDVEYVGPAEYPRYYIVKWFTGAKQPFHESYIRNISENDALHEGLVGVYEPQSDTTSQFKESGGFSANPTPSGLSYTIKGQAHQLEQADDFDDEQAAQDGYVHVVVGGGRDLAKVEYRGAVEENNQWHYVFMDGVLMKFHEMHLANLGDATFDEDDESDTTSQVVEDKIKNWAFRRIYSIADHMPLTNEQQAFLRNEAREAAYEVVDRAKALPYEGDGYDISDTTEQDMVNNSVEDATESFSKQCEEWVKWLRDLEDAYRIYPMGYYDELANKFVALADFIEPLQLQLQGEEESDTTSNFDSPEASEENWNGYFKGNVMKEADRGESRE